jgi:hypothetical protein
MMENRMGKDDRIAFVRQGYVFRVKVHSGCVDVRQHNLFEAASRENIEVFLSSAYNQHWLTPVNAACLQLMTHYPQ